TNSHGDQVPLLQVNVSPAEYALAAGVDSQLLPAVGLMLAAMILVGGLEFVAWKNTEHSDQKTT
ncbi:MAG: DUF368 domain-containing protein, partial [Pseudomonadales bacterium]|nr:DUF368 domain-containing protein [Pseudomonadales bacterium]